MIKIEKTEVLGWEHATRGMRNPTNSWDKSDSYPAVDCSACGIIEREGSYIPKDHDCSGFECFEVGPNDHALMTKLAANGSVHAKYRRMIMVYADVTAPLYWWKEYDTYQVGTVKNSCSTMHKIHAKEFDPDDFSHEHLIDISYNDKVAMYFGHIPITPRALLNYVIEILNNSREQYLKTGDKKYWWQMIQLLPTSYNQKRTVMLNYEVLANIYGHRKEHKLDEWREFCKWINGLPYSDVITLERE